MFLPGNNKLMKDNFVREMDELRKGREIIGLPVVSLASGREIGNVEDIIWDHEKRKLTYLILNEKGVGRRSKFVPFEQIVNIGEDAVTVRLVLPSEEVKDLYGGTKINEISGALVMTANGKNLGTIEDVTFNVSEGVVLGYEISNGLMGDLLSGRNLCLPMQ